MAESNVTFAFSVARLTFASLTPSTFVSARSIRRTHDAQVMPVTGNVISCVVFSMCVAMPGPLPPGKLKQLPKLLEHLIVAPVAEALADAAIEMAAEQYALELVDVALDGVSLLEDV